MMYDVHIIHLRASDIDMMQQQKTTSIWANYSDLSRGHPKWWFSKGIPPKSP